jgi:hypothetical protein
VTILNLRTPKIPETTRDEPRWLIWLLRFAAYALPLGFLLYVLYWNFLPFGYDKTFTIDVGSPGDTSGEFYLEPSRDLSARKTAPDGTTYRELNGIAYAVFKPKAVLKNAQITVSVEGEGVSIIPPVIDFNPDSVQWDYSWDFTQPATSTDGRHTNILKNVGMLSASTTLPQVLTGNAFPFDGCMYFDGKSRLELPGSADLFESGPFTVYVEWKPENSTDNFQQIVGHYNWEIAQNTTGVVFWIRTDDGAFSMSYPIDEKFFNNTHSLLAIYLPSSPNGHMGFYVDGINVDYFSIGSSTISSEYGNRDLSFGKNGFSTAANLKGCLKRVTISNNSVLPNSSQIKISYSGETGIRIPVLTTATTTLRAATIHVEQK